MIIQSKKAKAIDAYIDSHNKSCIKGKQKIEIDGKIEIRDSYILPPYLLTYNHNNGRFNLEIQEYEAKLGRKLDPADGEDVKKIKKLLLCEGIDSEDYNAEAEKLYNDLKLIGEQREFAVITHDGVVVNGNRRMATIERLHQEEPTGKWNDLWIVRLPEDISNSDLWKIEAGLQLSKEKVAEYGPVNNLLMIREGKKAGLSDKEIAASMYGWTEKQVTIDLDRLDLIDNFLLFFGQPNNYGLIKKFRLSEHFIDIQKGLVQKLKDSGAPKKEIVKKLEIVFAYLRANITKADLINLTHYDVRNICKILNDLKSTDALTNSFEKYKDIKQVPVEILVDNFDKASDVKKNLEDKSKPGKLIDRAITALNGIDRKGKHFKSDADVKIKLKTLNELVKEMKKELGIS